MQPHGVGTQGNSPEILRSWFIPIIINVVTCRIAKMHPRQPETIAPLEAESLFPVLPAILQQQDNIDKPIIDAANAY